MINLSKKSTISLEKNGSELKDITVGLDWGKIQSTALWGLLRSAENVDLDGSVSMFDANMQEIETVYFHHLRSSDGAIRHSGDDRSGDTSADNRDNEVIYINLEKITARAKFIYIYLNSYKKQDFSSIPYAKVRVIEGKHHDPKQTFATFNLASDQAYKGYVSMLMAKLVRMGNRWDFTALGEPIKAKDIDETIAFLQKNTI